MRLASPTPANPNSTLSNIKDLQKQPNRGYVSRDSLIGSGPTKVALDTPRGLYIKNLLTYDYWSLDTYMMRNKGATSVGRMKHFIYYTVYTLIKVH